MGKNTNETKNSQQNVLDDLRQIVAILDVQRLTRKTNKAKALVAHLLQTDLFSPLKAEKLSAAKEVAEKIVKNCQIVLKMEPSNHEYIETQEKYKQTLSVIERHQANLGNMFNEVIDLPLHHAIMSIDLEGYLNQKDFKNIKNVFKTLRKDGEVRNLFMQLSDEDIERLKEYLTEWFKANLEKAIGFNLFHQKEVRLNPDKIFQKADFICLMEFSQTKQCSLGQ